MRLAALVEAYDHVCCRYRLRAFEPFLQAHGIALTYHPIPRSWFARLALGKHLRDADAVVIQRKLLSAVEIHLLRRHTKRLFFDIDDAVWMRDSHAKKGFYSGKRQRRFRSMVRACDRVLAGNQYLALNATTFGAAATTLLPTCVDVVRYPLATHTEQPQLVWIGSSSTLNGLAQLQPTLNAIGATMPGVSLKLICDRFFTLDQLRVIECPWHSDTETRDLAASSIGISWIPDDPWSRGKCGLKVLQYMAAGLPVIANPVGVHPEMIQHGHNGYLATTEAEWVAAVQALASDPARRRAMGTAGRKIVEDRYSLQAGTAGWLALLQDTPPTQVAA